MDKSTYQNNEPQGFLDNLWDEPTVALLDAEGWEIWLSYVVYPQMILWGDH